MKILIDIEGFSLLERVMNACIYVFFIDLALNVLAVLFSVFNIVSVLLLYSILYLFYLWA